MSYKSGVVTFSEKMENYAKEFLTEAQQVNILKKRYLLSKEEEIIKAHKEGFNNAHIAEVATKELLETGIATSFLGKNKEDEEVERETKIGAADIKKLLEV